ncbi:ciliary microtubule inner protein 2C isoform X2 [Latimeria chalumnae]|uniref:ciliary microtubule inner protein 2C isoform X2 n=1 Tax=Latimeria chalumnae TaxID=7897 RepID=UPI0003C10AE8|nr:PREDICTED: UPF0573 protein C2orf70 homolog isoform X2 [Latimeria chalumnae]|eukprot:XP_005990972.1 PREDICTED: UPF0573 protein C2orf70 homolog isoform X2 [Latimeria chalumnae]
MASRSAGTLITHNNATYILPALMPGYLGHTPTAYFRCGETYGNATQKSFQDFRSAVLNSSQNPYKEGQFPTLYSNDPSLVIANRARNRDRWMHTCNWSRYNEDFNRMGELKQFSKVAQKHRDYYADKTGTLQKMNYFVLPGKEEDTFPCSPYTPYSHHHYPKHMKVEKKASLPMMLQGRKYQTFPSGIRTSSYDRIKRDLYFERR